MDIIQHYLFYHQIINDIPQLNSDFVLFGQNVDAILGCRSIALAMNDTQNALCSTISYILNTFNPEINRD